MLSKLALRKKFKILKLNDYNGIKIIKHTSIKEFQHINFTFKGKNFYFKTNLCYPEKPLQYHEGTVKTLNEDQKNQVYIVF